MSEFTPWNETVFDVASLSVEAQADLAAGKRVMLGSYEFSNNSNDNAFNMELALDDVSPNITAGLPAWAPSP